MAPKRSNAKVLSGRKQFDALTSPLRLEILGHLTEADGTSVSEVAARMGRPAAALYYQFRVLERAGLIAVAGRRATGGRSEALYRPVAERFAVPGEATDSSGRNLAERTLRTAHRMAERDLSAALAGDARTAGEARNCYAARLHFAAPPAVLAKINRHLSAIERLIVREGRRRDARDEPVEHLSLTIALLPLQGRSASPPRAGSRRKR